MKKITSLLIVLSIVISLRAQDTTSNKIAILPFIAKGIDPASVQTAESIFRMDLSKISSLEIISTIHSSEWFLFSPKKKISVLKNLS